MTEGYTSLLHIQDSLVEIPLCRSEGSGDGPSASYVCYVASILLWILVGRVLLEGLEDLTPPASTRTRSDSLQGLRIGEMN